MPIPEAHLAKNSPTATRALSTGRPYPLSEADRPTRTAAAPAELQAIIRYLDVEASARYSPTPTQTYCNIYACDYCYLSGVYLPRVWWKASALADIAAGKPVAAKYDDTVVELNANSLYSWLRDFGAEFGWQKAASLDALQTAANSGQVGVICAQRTLLNKPGHIAVVVPESAPPSVAQRTPGAIRIPLQSQAGRHNYCFSCAPGRWWEGSQFQAYGFWIHP
jgi:hypothetical protein